MALTPRRHGVTVTEAPIGRVPLEIAPTSIWGVVVTAPTADPGMVLVNDLEKAITDVGAGGTAARVLRAIADHGRSIGVMVIVEEGEGEDDADKAADQADKTKDGLLLLRTAEQEFGVKPRILAAPGLDDQEVVAALGVLCQQLDGFGYFYAAGDTPTDVATYAAGFGVRELMPIDGDFLVGEDISFATARAVGLRAQLDREVGYHKTISNVPVAGVTGVTKPRSWDLNSIDTDLGLLNGGNVTGIIRRQGLRFWGNRTCSADPRFAFESAVRTNQVLRDVIGQGLFPYIDQPLRADVTIDIIERINALGRREVRSGRLIGFEAFLAEGNTSDQLAAGKLRIGYRFTPCAPLEDLGVTSEITDEFYADFAQLVTEPS